MSYTKKGIQLLMAVTLLLVMASCKKGKNSKLELEPYLKLKCDYVHKIKGFYILGSKEMSKEVGGVSGK